MPSEKIYYGVLIFLCIASMLLSPFFYAGALKPKKAALRKEDGQWKLILLSNAVAAAVLFWIWWKWF
ncbi:hypothetical protein PP103_000157 [Neisseria gonorrhoeae]